MSRRLLPIGCGLVGLALVVFAVLSWTSSSGSARAGTVASTNWGSADPASARGSIPPPARPATHQPATHQPAAHLPAPLPAGTHLQLPRLAVNAPIVSVRAPGGVMQVPTDPETLGWWSDGVSPSAGRGSTVIVGHINYAGVSGALSVLPNTRAGDVVSLDEPAGPLKYAIQAVHTYPKDVGLPASLFATTGPARLVLITCGGPFDPSTGNYLDNIVALATPVR
jgi:sortase (surface protein transpeptidase)